MDSDKISIFMSAFEKDADIKRMIITEIKIMFEQKFHEINGVEKEIMCLTILNIEQNIGKFEYGTLSLGFKSFQGIYLPKFIEQNLNHIDLLNLIIIKNVNDDYLSKISQIIDMMIEQIIVDSDVATNIFEDTIRELFIPLIFSINSTIECIYFLSQ